jgi:hypothetical protein
MPFKRLNITSQLVSTNTRVSTSNITGALLLAGGAGIRGNVYADNIVLSGNLSTQNINASGNLSVGSITSTGTINAASITSSTGQVLSFPSSSGTIITTGDSRSISNKMLDNTAISINGTSVSLGNSFTVTATTSNTLTIGTGLTGTSFDGSAPVTIAINSSVTTLTNTQNLTNKTVTSLGNTSTIFDGGSSAYAIGYKAIPPGSTSSGNLLLTDAGKHVYVSAGVTVPPNSTAAVDIGTVITIVNSSGSSITVTQGSGVTLRLSSTTSTGNRTLAAYGLCSCIKVATDTWYISGSGMT